jgi:hypothetical protein
MDQNRLEGEASAEPRARHEQEKDNPGARLRTGPFLGFPVARLQLKSL